MKRLLILVTLFLAQNSWADLKACRHFVQDVLITGVVEDPSPGANHPYRLPKDEKTALKFIQQFDVKKLALQENKEARKNILKDCNAITKSNPREVFCESSIPSFNYFRALIFGIKNKYWSASTDTLAKNQLRSYINEIGKTEASLLEATLGINLLQMMGQEKIFNGLDGKKIDQAAKDAETAGQEMQATYQTKAREMNCKVYQDLAALEIKQASAFSIRLKALAAPLGK